MENPQCHCWPDCTKPDLRCKNRGTIALGKTKVCMACYELIKREDPMFIKELEAAKSQNKGKR